MNVLNSCEESKTPFSSAFQQTSVIVMEWQRCILLTVQFRCPCFNGPEAVMVPLVTSLATQMRASNPLFLKL